MPGEKSPQKRKHNLVLLKEYDRNVYDSVKEREDNVIGAQIQAARKACGLSKTRLAEVLSQYGLTIHRQGIGKWESGGSVPSAYQLVAICHALKIEDGIAFFTGEPKRPDELNEEGMKKLADYRADLVASGRYKPRVPSVKQKIRYINMDVSTIPASAGTGDFLDEENFEKVRFPESAVPKDADFGVRVHGDSMEPVYHDQQIAWIQRCESLRPGEVGLFMYDGCGYLKVYDEQEIDTEDFDMEEDIGYSQPILVSYNEEYDPIEVSPDFDFRVVGRVLN